tara:strand:+ start:2239 stop:2463 length:225 start_codon:yes stop_codon:yes gene_type:complete
MSKCIFYGIPSQTATTENAKANLLNDLSTYLENGGLILTNNTISLNIGNGLKFTDSKLTLDRNALVSDLEQYNI